jgi:hypothetical protein
MARIDIAKLTVAILEGKVKALVGDEAIKEIKKPLIETELQNSLRIATKKAEQRFSTEYYDREICDLVRQMPLADLPSIQKAIRGFYDTPAAPVAAGAFRNQLEAIVPKDIKPERIETAVASYMEILREELISIDALREKLNALANIETARNTARTIEELSQIKRLVAELLARDTTTRPITLARPKAVVAKELLDRIERGRIFLNELRKSPPSSKDELHEKSEVWHRWRRSCEQTIRESFSPPRPLDWLPVPRHIDHNQPRWEDRAKHLPDDYGKDLAYLEDLLGRLNVYEETSRPSESRPTQHAADGG